MSKEVMESPGSTSKEDGEENVLETTSADEEKTSPVPTKRGRGRPRKHPKELVPVVETGEPKVKRSKGRPKGSFGKTKKPAPDPSEKRPRGRPKSSRTKLTPDPSEKRPRGRPKSSRTKQSAGDSPSERVSGRPRGSPIKTPEVAASGSEYEESEPDSTRSKSDSEEDEYTPKGVKKIPPKTAKSKGTTDSDEEEYRPKGVRRSPQKNKRSKAKTPSPTKSTRETRRTRNKPQEEEEEIVKTTSPDKEASEELDEQE